MRLVEDPEKLIRLEALFARLFRVDEKTVLVRATSIDPVYYPQSDSRALAEIHFANDFFSSALHEIAHWLIAGSERRTKLDYGYWYKPDGRDQKEQQDFEAFEARNQGLEWILSTAANHDFHVSTDNLSGDTTDGSNFAHAVRQNALLFLEKGFSGRSKILIEALINEFGDQQAFSRYWYLVEKNGSLPTY
jgi:elongation factor P hydroxylase